MRGPCQFAFDDVVRACWYEAELALETVLGQAGR